MMVDENKVHETWGRVRILLAAPPPVYRDSARIGTVFIDVLFGAVVAKALDLSTSPNGVPAAGRAQLVLAMVVTITSWLGYHNSSGRNSYRIMFFNLPLLQFVIEISHLLIYWLLVTTSAQWQGGRHLPVNKTAIPETVLVAVVFVLFCAWDFTALAMRRSDKYAEMKVDDDKPRRRGVTLCYTVLVVFLAIITCITRAHGLWVFILAVILVVLVVSHRWLQNVVQVPAERTVQQSVDNAEASSSTASEISDTNSATH